MEAPGNNEVPIQCRSGCGFYGTSATEGMCSKCYKDYLQKRQAPPSGPSGQSFRGDTISAAPCVETASPTVPVVIASGVASSLLKDGGPSPFMQDSEDTSTGALAAIAADASTSSVDPCSSQSEPSGAAGTSFGDAPSPSTEESPDKKKKNRCAVCRKKVGLTGFGCRCGGLFCSVHRYSDKHDCSFDYRTHGAEEIRKNNPVIKGEKVQQI